MGNSGRGCPYGASAAGYLLGCINHQATEFNNCQIRSPKNVIAAIYSRTHAAPHGNVLVGDAGDAREITLLHGFTILTKPVVKCTCRIPVLIQVNPGDNLVE